MLTVWTLLALSHSQQGKADCGAPIHVGDAKLSVSYWIEDAHCHFIVNATEVDAIGVSRVSWPLEHAGHITVNGETVDEDTNATGHVEPFAILPMWSTYSEKDVVLTDSTVHVHVEGKAFVSFGMAEDPALVLGEVVPDSYASREWVYGAPGWAMWLIHLPMAAAALLFLWGADMYLAVMVLRIWLVTSFWVDVYVWSTTAVHLAGNSGGLFMGVTVFRLLLLSYFMYIIHEKPRRLPGEWGWPRPWVSYSYFGLLALYLGGVLIMGKVGAIEIAVVALGVGVLLMSVHFSRYLALAILHTLLGIVANLGAGLLAPAAMWYAYLHRMKEHSGEKWAHD